MIRSALAAGCLLALATAADAHAATGCGALAKLTFPDTTVSAAEEVTSGTLTPYPGARPMGQMPAFCRVTGVLHPSSDSQIRFEVWLPEDKWSGKLLGVGNGGFAGSIGYDQMAGYLKRGFAVAGSDAGHQAQATDASWAYEHPEKVKDFGWRAVHLTADLAKELIRGYYGKPQEKAYFDSCSDGGREALMEAQRFPADYDGILAGAPANNWSRMLGSGVAVTQSLMADPRSYFSSLKLPAIQSAALAACDAADGVKDGIINNPLACHFNPATLLCKEGDALNCLTQPQVAALEAIYTGGKNSQGQIIFPGTMMGDETAWENWIIGDDPGGSYGAQYVANDFRYLITGDPKWDPLTANVDQSLQQSQEHSADVDSTNPDLSAFAERGGKLILYHGWNDPAISPLNTIAYYRQVQQTMGGEKTASFARLYMAPGMEHCTGGPGPSAFGQLGIPTAKGAPFGIFTALEDWTEKGTAPGEIYATKYAGPLGPGMKPVMTRPLCAYPETAKYKGSGDTNDASNFACVEP
jgi:hypothetical protein